MAANNGIEDTRAVGAALAYTPAGNQWLQANEDWIYKGEEWAKNSIAQQWGGSDVAVNILRGCRFQALSLVSRTEVYFFTRHDAEPLANSWWNVAECSPLTMDNGIVEKIWRIDPRPAEKRGKPCEKVLM